MFRRIKTRGRYVVSNNWFTFILTICLKKSIIFEILTTFGTEFYFLFVTPEVMLGAVNESLPFEHHYFLGLPQQFLKLQTLYLGF